MKIRQDVDGERGEKGEKGGRRERDSEFSRFRGMVERSARVALAAFAVTFAISCGDEPTGKDGGTGDGGTTDADTDHDTGTDTGPSSLCTQYGPGDPHRMVFQLDDEASPSGGSYFYKFRGISGSGDGRIAHFVRFPASMSTSEGVSFETGEQVLDNFPGIGDVMLECCEMTANECTPSSGDLACTATLVSGNGW